MKTTPKGLDFAENPWRSWSAEDRVFYKYFIPKNGRLYHYTNQAGFLGILSSLSLWCTDVRFFNDRTEVEHAYDLLRKIIKRQKQKYNKSGIQHAVLSHISNRLNSHDSKPRYVVCFSEKPDDLNQYRAYASPGAGYCMGFNQDELWVFAFANDGTVGRCLYGESEQTSVLEELIQDSIKELDEYFPATGPGEINEDLAASRASGFLSSFSRIAPLFKNSAFREEREIRIVFGEAKDKKDLQFRCGKMTIVPYREIKFSLPDTRFMTPEIIYIKGTSEPDLTRLGAEQFLFAKGFSDGALVDSLVPYRENV